MRILKSTLTSLLLSAFYISRNYAAPNPLPEILTIRSAATAALTHNPSILKIQEKYQETESQIGLSKAALYPNVSALLNGNYKKDPTSTPFFRFGGSPYNQYLLDLKISQTLTFGTQSGLMIPIIDREITSLNLEISSRELSGKIVTAFYKIILDQKLLETLIQSETLRKEALATAEKRYQIGRGQKLDILQIKTQLALISPKIAQAKNQIEIDASTLATFLGAPNTQEIHLSGSLSPIPLKQIQKEIESTSPHFPELEQLAANQKRLNSEKEVSFAKHLPSLTGSLEWSRTSFTKSQLLDSAATGWTFGLQLNLPLFSGLSSLDERRLFASRNAQVQLEEETLKNNLLLQKTQTSRNVLLSWQTISSATQAFQIAGDSLKEAKRNYQFAAIDLLQYLAIQEAYLEAHSSLYQAQYLYLTSLVSHFIASGASLNHLIGLLEGLSS